MTKKSIKLSHVVANDDGSSANKLAFWGEKDGKLIIKTELFKTAIHEGGANLASVGLEDSGIYGINGKVFSIDETLDGIDTRADMGYQLSDGAVAMNQYSLSKCGFSGRDVYLATGLPVEDFYRGTSLMPLAEYKENKAAAFLNAEILNVIDETGTPAATDHKSLVNVVSSSVYPEGASAYYDMVISTDGVRDDSRFAGDVVIIDMGSYTTDICLVGKGGKVRQDSIKTIKDCGFLKMFDNFKKGCVASGLGIQTDRIPRERMEKALLTNKLETIRQEIDVKDIVEAVIKEITDEITTKTKLLLGDRLDFVTDIVAIGGGANYIKNHFTEFSEVIQVPSNPQFSTAIGYLKLATFFGTEDIENDLT